MDPVYIALKIECDVLISENYEEELGFLAHLLQFFSGPWIFKGRVLERSSNWSGKIIWRYVVLDVHDFLRPLGGMSKISPRGFLAKGDQYLLAELERELSSSASRVEDKRIKFLVPVETFALDNTGRLYHSITELKPEPKCIADFYKLTLNIEGGFPSLIPKGVDEPNVHSV
jgi:hypothetical protein